MIDKPSLPDPEAVLQPVLQVGARRFDGGLQRQSPGKVGGDRRGQRAATPMCIDAKNTSRRVGAGLPARGDQNIRELVAGQVPPLDQKGDAIR